MSFFGKYLLHRIKWYFKVIILGIFLLPLFIFIFQPERDIVYHFGKSAAEYITYDTAVKIQDNIFANVEGDIDPESIRIITDTTGIFLHSCTFRLTGFPDNFILCTRDGALFERLKTALNLRPEIKGITDEDGSLSFSFKSEWYGKDVPEKIQNLLAETKLFQGRIYSSKGRLFPFDTLYNSKKFKIEDYLYAMNSNFSPDSEYTLFITKKFLPEYRSENPGTCYLLVIDEIPSPVRLIDTNAGMIFFLTGCALIIILIFAFKFRKRIM